jgi:20S proteasome alpha/beta subunit
MTVIIGIKTNKKDSLDGIVLIADRQLTMIEEKAGQEFPTSKKSTEKLVFGNNWAMGYAGGSSDDQIGRFMQIMYGDKRVGSSTERANKIIEEALKRKQEFGKISAFEKRKIQFEEIALLNSDMMSNDETANVARDAYVFLLAINKPELNIYKIDEFGNMFDPDDNDFPYFCIGSGKKGAKKFIEEYIEGEDVDEGGNVILDIPKAIDLGINALHKAHVDPYTSGPADLVVLTKNGVEHYGDSIKTAIKKAELEKVEEIKSKYLEKK